MKQGLTFFGSEAMIWLAVFRSMTQLTWPLPLGAAFMRSFWKKRQKSWYFLANSFKQKYLYSPLLDRSFECWWESSVQHHHHLNSSVVHQSPPSRRNPRWAAQNKLRHLSKTLTPEVRTHSEGPDSCSEGTPSRGPAGRRSGWLEAEFERWAWPRRWPSTQRGWWSVEESRPKRGEKLMMMLGKWDF